MDQYALIGEGKCGSALHLSFKKAGLNLLSFNRKQMLAHFIAKISLENQSSVLFLAVQDHKLEPLIRELGAFEKLPQAICHLSAATDLSIFKPISLKCDVAMFHPLASLSRVRAIPHNSIAGITATSQAMEENLFDLARKLGLNPVKISPTNQTKYHLGAVFASNLPLALIEISNNFFKSVGLEENQAKQAALSLLESMVENIRQSSTLSEALSGPIARGDVSTVARHIEALPYSERRIYNALSNKLLHISPAHKHDKALISQLLAR